MKPKNSAERLLALPRSVGCCGGVAGIRTLVVAAGFLVTMLLGCALPVSPVDSGGTAPVTGVSAGLQASVRLQFTLDDEAVAPSPPLTALSGRPAKAAASVVVRFISVFPGSTQTVVTRNETLSATTGGTIDATFANVPVTTTVVQVQIDGAQIGGYTDFHGVADLVAGANTVRLVGVGTGYPTDRAAHLVEQVALTDEARARAPAALANAARSAVTAAGTTGSFAYSDAYNALLSQIVPASLVRLVVDANQTSLSGFLATATTPHWTLANTQAWLASEVAPLTPAQMLFLGVIRHGVGGTGFVVSGDAGRTQAAVTRYDTTSHNIGDYCSHAGSLGCGMVMADRSVVVGGYDRTAQCPIVFRWAGTTAGSSANASSLVWVRRFTELPATTDPNPAVRHIGIDGSGRLVCSVRNAAAGTWALYRLDAATGAGVAVSPSTAGSVTVGEIPVPASYTAVGLPLAATSATIARFNALTLVMLSNRTANSVGATVAVAAGSASLRQASGRPVATARTDVGAGHPEPDQDLQRRLRAVEKSMPRPIEGRASPGAAVRSTVRADTVGQSVQFIMYPGGTTLSATCRKVSPIAGQTGNTLYYLDDAAVYDATAQSLINSLDAAWPPIYQTNRATFGDEPGTTFDGLTLGGDITILLTPSITGSTAGYFYSGDLYAPDRIIGGLTNQRKMFYMKYNPAQTTVAGLSGTMAHEFQHMINFFQRKSLGVDEADWLNEAMSGYAEHVNGYGASTNQSKALQSRYYLAAVNRTVLPAGELDESVGWPGNSESYGQVYLFGTWLGQRYGANGSLRGLLTQGTAGRAAVAALTGKPFDRVVAEWQMALYVNAVGTGSIYGYNDLDLRRTYTFTSPLAPVTLTGPAVTANTGTLPFSTPTLTLAPYTCAYVEITNGPTVGPITVTVPATVAAFAIYR